MALFTGGRSNTGALVFYLDVLEALALIENEQPAAAPGGYCERADDCVCGGDLPRVREGCSEWVKSESAPAPADEQATFEITEQGAAEWASRHNVDHALKHFSTQRNAIEDARTLHLLTATPQPPALPFPPPILASRSRAQRLIAGSDHSIMRTISMGDAVSASSTTISVPRQYASATLSACSTNDIPGPGMRTSKRLNAPR